MLFPRGALMTDRIVRIPALGEAILDPKTKQACTELLEQTSRELDKQIKRAGELLGADRVHLFLRAIGAHIETELDTRLKLPPGQS
jgi:hypothetical protein